MEMVMDVRGVVELPKVGLTEEVKTGDRHTPLRRK